MNTVTSYAAIVALAAASIAIAEPIEDVANYQDELERYQAERAAAGPSIGEEDRQIMANTAVELAESMPDPGLKTGQMAPDFTLPNASGESVSLAGLLEDGPVVLVFYRGAWCPYCNLHLHALHASLPAIEKTGAQLVAITPQMPDRSRAQIEEAGYPFEVLSDLDDSVMQSYGLYFEVPAALSDLYKRVFSLDIAEYNGPGRYALPVPATFIVDQSGVIRFADANVDYQKRTEPAVIIAELERLKR